MVSKRAGFGENIFIYGVYVIFYRLLHEVFETYWSYRSLYIITLNLSVVFI